uniref:Uncharacterized protein n=1 Tax=Anguilla anguilla TaxID=7936 RepID=A0A0E9SWM3_ANGAN
MTAALGKLLILDMSRPILMRGKGE